MKKAKGKPKLIRKPEGYWQYAPLPSRNELEKYYAEKYFQQGKGSYSASYTPDEMRYFRLKADLVYRQISRLRPKKFRKTLLDVGCGEGWVLERMHCAQVKVKGFDFSSFGLMKFHPHLERFFDQGDVFKLLEREKSSGYRYDVVALMNVIEHVLDPDKMIDLLKSILSPKGLLLIVAPNDFSALHEHLLKVRYITEQFWLAYPDHISYFNKESMQNFLEVKGLKVEAVVADNPIDLNLMNSNTNYINDRVKGKETHYMRVRVDNFLGGINTDKLLDLYTTLGSMGVGRDLNYYCSLKQ